MYFSLGTARMRSIPERRLWSLNGCRICFDFGRTLASCLMIFFYSLSPCVSLCVFLSMLLSFYNSIAAPQITLPSAGLVTLKFE
ncbi:hypothetical protein RchiOBHm_Chr2g0100291 [Rosa chinensis]|uniref:Uncharacterized protein n=1 Tax=Rosa chinensis TaxID=74649 RepID=A0A2P6RM36_ROSCH|nr:hypothetical protein RchiOBHm_Chr2g0100291 [Rosa chinensis]